MDTDKLKRLAEGAISASSTLGRGSAMARFQTAATPQAVLALIAENEGKAEQFRLLDEEYVAMRADNERLKRQMENAVEACDVLLTERDEAVALLHEIGIFSGDVDTVAAFLTRIDSETSK